MKQIHQCIRRHNNCIQLLRTSSHALPNASSWASSDARDFSKNAPPVPQIGIQGLMQLDITEYGLDAFGGDANEDSLLADQRMAYWVSPGKPGLYQLCWNPKLSPSSDAADFSEVIGTLEMLSYLSVVGRLRYLRIFS